MERQERREGKEGRTCLGFPSSDLRSLMYWYATWAGMPASGSLQCGPRVSMTYGHYTSTGQELVVEERPGKQREGKGITSSWEGGWSGIWRRKHYQSTDHLLGGLA